MKLKIFPPKEYRKQIAKEQQPYDTSLKAWFLGYESWFIGRYLFFLRYAEWYRLNNSLIFNRILGGCVKILYRKYGRKTGFQIGLNTCDFGIRFYHLGWCIVNSQAHIGKNATFYPGVCIGMKALNEVPTIGDNVFISLGAKVIGKVRIGDNVTIAPNAIVTKDVPDNAVVGGIPTKIIRMKTVANKNSSI